MKSVILSTPTARQTALAYVRDAPEGHHVIIKAPTRKLSQNALLHAELTDIANTREWAGRKWDVETWKRLVTAAWMRARGDQVLILPALDGQGIDCVFRRTSELTVAECAELVEFVRAWKETG